MQKQKSTAKAKGYAKDQDQGHAKESDRAKSPPHPLPPYTCLLV